MTWLWPHEEPVSSGTLSRLVSEQRAAEEDRERMLAAAKDGGPRPLVVPHPEELRAHPAAKSVPMRLRKVV
jgi:hypothetical protein